MPSLTSQQAFNLAMQKHEAGRLREAEHLYRQILSQQPKHAGAMQLLGVIAHQSGRNDAAVTLIREAIALRPHWPQAYSNLGNCLKGLGKIDEAITAYRTAIEQGPTLSGVHCNLANALSDAGQLDAAIEAYGTAMALNPALPDFASSQNNLGNALKAGGQIGSAIAAYRRAIQINPTDAEIDSNLMLALHYSPAFDTAAIAEEHRRWNWQHALPLETKKRTFENDPDPNRRLRIGYVSADFREHVAGRNLLPIFRHHDHERFEIICYANVANPDGMTRQLQEMTDGWRSIFGISDEQAAEQIRRDRIDILIDLSLHTAGNRLLMFARKPAPVQVSFLGYPASTGLIAIDYRFSDPHLDPPGMDESIYSEKTVRLPSTYWIYDPMEGRNIPVNELPAIGNHFTTFGCLNHFCKINDGVLGLWAKVMRQVDDSRLLLLSSEGSHRQRALDQLTKEGIDPARVAFVPRQPRPSYLKTFHRIDLCLDSFPYNGHTTTLDSFWMGVPVVTLAGQTAVSRAGLSQLTNLGVAGLAAKNPDEFVKIAVDLASDLPRLQQLRLTLRHQMEQSPLLDAPAFTRAHEASFRTMWRAALTRINAPDQ